MADLPHAESDRFSVIVERHAPHLYDYCRALLPDRQDAADTARLTLVVAYSLLDRLEDVGRVRAWLLALARRERRIADPVRSQLLARLTGLPAGEPEHLHPKTGAAQTAAAALKALPAVEREVLDLVYRHYLSSADVAAVLGESADRASALLARAVASFERVHEHDADSTGLGAQPPGSPGVLVAGVRAISAIPLVPLPPSILAGAFSVVADPDFASNREFLAAATGNLGPDGFPLPRRYAHPAPDRQEHVSQQSLWAKTLARCAVLQGVAHRAGLAGGVQPRKLAVLGGVLVALVAAFAVMASSSSGVPNAISRAIGQALGQDPVGPSRVSTRRLPQPLPILALLPGKHNKGIILPVLPAPGPTPSHKRHPAPSPPMTTPPVTPSSSPTPSSPSPTPSSPSPTPSSPSPTPSSPTPSATLTP